jgi:hypothetical protein
MLCHLTPGLPSPGPTGCDFAHSLACLRRCHRPMRLYAIRSRRMMSTAMPSEAMTICAVRLVTQMSGCGVASARHRRRRRRRRLTNVDMMDVRGERWDNDMGDGRGT